jgi:hypothetical protein
LTQSKSVSFRNRGRVVRVVIPVGDPLRKALDAAKVGTFDRSWRRTNLHLDPSPAESAISKLETRTKSQTVSQTVRKCSPEKIEKAE